MGVCAMHGEFVRSYHAFIEPHNCSAAEMEYRTLGVSGLTVSALSFGTARFGGTAEFFKAWGEIDRLR